MSSNRRTDNDRAPQTQAALAHLGAERLADELMELAKRHPEVEQRLQRLLRPTDPAATAKELTKRINSLQRGRKPIAYGESLDLARKMKDIVAAIEDEVLPVAPTDALELAEAFLQTDEKIHLRLQETSGAITKSYIAGGRLWLKAAKACGPGEDWAGRLYELLTRDTCSLREPMLESSAALLSEHQLFRLVKWYERDAAAAKPDEEGKNPNRFKALIKMQQAADALGDVGLMEKAMRLRLGEPNDRQKESLIEKELSLGRPDRALRRLKALSDKDSSDYWNLAAQCHRASGDNYELLEALWHLFARTCAPEVLAEILTLAPEEDRSELMDRADDLVREKAPLLKAAGFFFDTERPEEAESYLLERASELESTFYRSIHSLVEKAQNASRPKVQVLCYRCLLLDILTSARRKAYGHGAEYLSLLQQLDADIEDYSPLPDHEAFYAQVRQDHKRKSAFWKQVPKDV